MVSVSGTDACPERAIAPTWRGRESKGILKRMYALALIRYRRPVEEVVVHQEAHRAFQRKLLEEGKLIAAGPHDPRFSGMMLLRVDDNNAQKTLDAIRDADPYYQNGVVQYELLSWNVVIGKENLDKL